MARKMIRRWLPDPKHIHTQPILRPVAQWLHDSNLWYLNRRSAAGACAVGLFWAFVPIPWQMLPAAITAILFRVNLPVSVVLVWITNPLTMPPIFYFTYKLGSWLLRTPPRPVEFEMTWAWLTGELIVVWQPFLLGSLVVATLASTLGYFAMRGFWRLHAVRDWERRRDRRRHAHDQKERQRVKRP
jgi:uncharacterized protein (DUF2062 family)